MVILLITPERILLYTSHRNFLPHVCDKRLNLCFRNWATSHHQTKTTKPRERTPVVWPLSHTSERSFTLGFLGEVRPVSWQKETVDTRPIHCCSTDEVSSRFMGYENGTTTYMHRIPSLGLWSNKGYLWSCDSRVIVLRLLCVNSERFNFQFTRESPVIFIGKREVKTYRRLIFRTVGLRKRGGLQVLT